MPFVSCQENEAGAMVMSKEQIPFDVRIARIRVMPGDTLVLMTGARLSAVQFGYIGEGEGDAGRMA